ncbi:MAG: beta-propeller domain-containing protein, partial [Cyanobacteria bacterium J06633_2]
METSGNFEQFTSAAALETYLVDTALKQYEALFGQDGSYYFPLYAAGDTVSTATSTSRTDFSETNTQVDGVDEADLVETDGEFIYQVNGQLLTIVDARQEKELDIASQFALSPSGNDIVSGSTDLRIALDFIQPIEGWSSIDGMYLQGDRLTVIASGWSPSITDSDEAASSFFYDPGRSEVHVTVFDIENPFKPKVLETSTLEGALISSRAIGDEVFVVTSDPFHLPPPLLLESSDDGRELSSATLQDDIFFPYPPISGTYETKDEYLARISGQVLELGLPNITTQNGAGYVVSSGFLTQPTDVYQPLDERWLQLATLSTFDVGDQHLGVDASTSLPTEWVGEMFVSANYLYLLKTTYGRGTSQTDILQLDLETSELVARGSVPGSIDDQFSVDEHDGYLRVATTTGFGNRSRNNIYVLEQNQSSLEIVGQVEGLAPGERIFSTRFRGDHGFVVTFRQVDPLFTLDLSNPRKPKVVGELKVPGFSEYLQVIEDGNRTLILGVGQDADPDTGLVEGLKVSLFDVTDLKNPKEVDSYLFEGDYTSSEALWDHHAITYSPEHQLLAIPSQFYNLNDFRSETTLQVFRVDGKKGLTSLGEINHDDWINRSLYIDNTLFAVSQKEISAHRIPNLRELSSVEWSGKGTGLQLFAAAAEASLEGGDRDDQLNGNASRNLLEGKEGNDIIRGGAGNDRLLGQDDDDNLFGGKGRDRLLGGHGDDEIHGGKGRDRLLGGKGDDQLMGDAGSDILIGGHGAD